MTKKELLINFINSLSEEQLLSLLDTACLLAGELSRKVFPYNKYRMWELQEADILCMRLSSQELCRRIYILITE